MHAWSGRREQPRSRTFAALTDRLYAPLNHSFWIDAADCYTAPSSDFFQRYSSSMCELLSNNAGPVYSMSGKGGGTKEHKGATAWKKKKTPQLGEGPGG